MSTKRATRDIKVTREKIKISRLQDRDGQVGEGRYPPATNFVSERRCPIFQVSNVTGENLPLLKMFLNLLSTRSPNTSKYICSHQIVSITNDLDAEPAEFQIDDTYQVPGVGTVVSGTTFRGTIRINDSLLLGPDPLGHFHPIAIKYEGRLKLKIHLM